MFLRALLAATVVVTALLSQIPLHSALAADPINVVVTLPVLKDFSEQVGGPHVHVTSLMTGHESEHTYSPKPSDLIAVRKAQVLVEIGVGLEVWVGKLVRNAGNPKLVVVTTSKGIGLIRDTPGHNGPVTAAQEKVHGGNPHVWLDPESASTMLRHITEAFIKIDPAHAGDYRKNQAEYLQQLDQTRADLIARLRTVQDRRVIVHHPAWPYFARRFGLQIVGTIETQSGAEPSAHRLQALITQIRKDGIRVIISEPQLNPKIPELLARETGARVVKLTTLPGALPGTETYLDMLRYNVLQLAHALETS
jgi:ABC-type Zn uptake system ZnuABC Zn-binding protein ZnuA